jgi:hypothetical protein
MATNTTNYNLIKPELTDNVDVDDINGNMDVIDEALVSIRETAEKTADYTLALEDAGKIVNMNKSGAAALTVPTNTDVAFPIDTVIGVYNQSSDDVTVAGDSGVDVRNAGTVAQYGEASLRKRATNEWVMVGG